MSQNEEPSSCQCNAFSASTAPEPLAHIHVKTYPAMPVPLNSGERTAEESDILDIRAVGIGSLGSRMVQLLSRNLSGVTCHEIAHDFEQNSAGDMDALVSSVRSCDLLFILTGFDDDCCVGIAKALGSASCETGVLTLLVTPLAGVVPDLHQCDSRQAKWFDSMFNVSGEALPSQEDAITLRPESLSGYSMRHVVATITNLTTHRTGICIDFADITAIMKEGSVGRMGVGVASDSARGATAAIRAIERLEAQGVGIANATGVIAAVHGSGNISMEDYEAASKVIHEQISPDANVIVGVVSDENLGGSVKVTIQAIH